MPSKKKARPRPRPGARPRPRPGVAQSKKVARTPAIKNTAANRAKAIRELQIDVPIYRTRVVGGRLELHCYGGQVLLWPPK